MHYRAVVPLYAGANGPQVCAPGELLPDGWPNVELLVRKGWVVPVDEPKGGD